MRLNDVDPPAIDAGDRPGPDVPMGQWPAELYVAIESVAYDSAQWDASPVLLWDDPDNEWDELGDEVVAFTDAICWFQGCDIDHPPPDTAGRFGSSTATIDLDNRDGRWSRYSPAGQLVFYPPGRMVLLWAVVDGDPWWLFAGRIATWSEVGDVVTLTAVDAFSELNLRLNEWTAGAAGDSTRDRLDAIVALIGWGGPTRFNNGDVDLLAHTTDASPLEEMQAVAESDGGVLFVDADGTLVYRNRRWSAGRADQTSIPVVSGNVCDAPVVVWDLRLTTDDDTLVNLVTLANIAEPPLVAAAEDTVSRDRFGSYTLPQNRDRDLWSTEAEGIALAEFIVAARGDPTTRISSASLWLHDARHDYWLVGIDLRRGDLVSLVQDVRAQDGSLQRIAAYLVVASVRHQITPGAWVTTFGTSRTVGNVLVTRWDESPYSWDDSSTGNVWSH